MRYAPCDLLLSNVLKLLPSVLDLLTFLRSILHPAPKLSSFQSGAINFHIPAMTDSQYKYDDLLLADLVNYTVVSDAKLAKTGKISCQWSAKGQRRLGQPVIDCSHDTPGGSRSDSFQVLYNIAVVDKVPGHLPNRSMIWSWGMALSGSKVCNRASAKAVSLRSSSSSSMAP